MKKIILIYGGLSGAIVIGSMILGFAFSESEHAASSQAFGYLIMIVALSMIFLGIKRYRDRDLGGVIKFGPAFVLGLAIAAMAGVMYVAGWEAYLAATDHAFIGEYTAGIIEKKRAAGISGAELETLIAEMDALAKNYAKPFYRMPMTFIEIFPVGFVIALASAALLRNPKILPARG